MRCGCTIPARVVVVRSLHPVHAPHDWIHAPQERIYTPWLHKGNIYQKYYSLPTYIIHARIKTPILSVVACSVAEVKSFSCIFERYAIYLPFHFIVGPSFSVHVVSLDMAAVLIYVLWTAKVSIHLANVHTEETCFVGKGAIECSWYHAIVVHLNVLYHFVLASHMQSCHFWVTKVLSD